MLSRLVLLLESVGKLPADVRQTIDLYLMYSQDSLYGAALQMADELRCAAPGLRVLCHCGGGKFNGQLKKAYTSGARLALILDPADSANMTLRLRTLDEEGSTEAVDYQQLVTKVKGLIAV
jgi:histidyl-tRNA synthetase